MHLDPILPVIVQAAFAVLVIGAILRLLRQPYVVGYLITGVFLGPHGLSIITDTAALARVGDLGVVLLLFFVGMEVSLSRLAAAWRVALLGTTLQVLVSVGCAAALGSYLQWPFNRILLVGFVISLSSTAVVFKLLQDWGEFDTTTGQNAVGILLVQDVAIIPMLIALAAMGGRRPDAGQIALQAVGAAICGGLVVWVAIRGTLHLPMRRLLRADHEMQVFAALTICFGLATLTGLTGLSTALGAFVAGIVVAAARETEWVHQSLGSFRTVFMALFFVSVGMLVDVPFVLHNAALLAALVALVLVTNTAINTVSLRLLGTPWGQAAYIGGLLAQIGEFSFVLGAVGREEGIIGEYGYQATVATIALSLIFSPVWIHVVRKVAGHPTGPAGAQQD